MDRKRVFHGKRPQLLPPKHRRDKGFAKLGFNGIIESPQIWVFHGECIIVVLFAFCCEYRCHLLSFARVLLQDDKNSTRTKRIAFSNTESSSNRSTSASELNMMWDRTVILCGAAPCYTKVEDCTSRVKSIERGNISKTNSA